MSPGGEIGRALLIPAGSVYTLPISLSGEVQLRGRVKLLPHDWRDGRGTVSASVTVTTENGEHQTIWSRRVGSDRRHGRPRGFRLDCTLPATTVALELRVERRGRARHGHVARAIWVEPVLFDPNAPPLPSPQRAIHSVQPAAEGSPLISVLMPVHNPPLQMLEQAIESVCGQTYGNWELCMTDDGSSEPAVIDLLRRYTSQDARIQLARHDRARGISDATNAALAMAGGEFIALLDHDDELTPDALAQVAQRLASQPDLDMIYSDEDVVSADGDRLQWHPKPGWSPEHMTTVMYTCHLGVYRRELAVAVGGFDSQFDGCQDYDLVLRLMEHTDRVAHIPRILYHWRAHAASTAGGDQAKPYAYLSQPGAIAAHLRRVGVDADVRFAEHPGMHRIVHRVAPEADVDIVLAVADERGLTQAAASWATQTHQAFNVVVGAPEHKSSEIASAIAEGGIAPDRIMVVSADPVADQAAALNAAVAQARSTRLVLMQALTEGITHDWLARLLGYAQQASIGAAGPIVVARDGRLSQAGIAIPEGVPLWINHGRPASVAPPVVGNVSAVSGVLATRRETFDALEGLDTSFGDLALLVYCLSAQERGLRTVLVPDARLRIALRDRPNNDLPAIWRLRDRWAARHDSDPYYNPCYRTDQADYSRRPQVV
jgi:GT2 family glycosyltransferase